MDINLRQDGAVRVRFGVVCRSVQGPTQMDGSSSVQATKHSVIVALRFCQTLHLFTKIRFHHTVVSNHCHNIMATDALISFKAGQCDLNVWQAPANSSRSSMLTPSAGQKGQARSHSWISLPVRGRWCVSCRQTPSAPSDSLPQSSFTFAGAPVPPHPHPPTST